MATVRRSAISSCLASSELGTGFDNLIWIAVTTPSRNVTATLSKGSIFQKKHSVPSSRGIVSPGPHSLSISARVVFPGYAPRKLAGSIARVGVSSGASAIGAFNGSISIGSSGVDEITFDFLFEPPVVSIADISFAFGGAWRRLLAAASGRCHDGDLLDLSCLSMLVSGPREAPSSFGVLFFATVVLVFSFELGRRSFQAVFRTSGSKSRAARSERLGLLWLEALDLGICSCVICGVVFVFLE